MIAASILTFFLYTPTTHGVPKDRVPLVERTMGDSTHEPRLVQHTEKNASQPSPIESDGLDKKPPLEESTLLVMDLVKEDMSDSSLQAHIQSVLREGATTAHSGPVTSISEIRADLDASARKQLLGCNAEGCMSRVAESVRAQRVLGGSVTTIGGDVILSLLFVDAQTGQRLGEANAKFPAHPAVATFTVSQLVHTAMGQTLAVDEIPVVIQVSPENVPFEITVDGEPINLGPDSSGSTAILSVTPGIHQIAVRASGYADFLSTVEVRDNALRLNPVLEPSSITLWPVTLLFVSASALSAGAGITLGLVAQDLYAGNVPVLPFEEKNSYAFANPISSAELNQKEQEIVQTMWAANVCYASMFVFASLGVATLASDIVLNAME